MGRGIAQKFALRLFSLVLILGLPACRSPFRDTLELVVKDYSTPETEISPLDGEGISQTTVIVITFSETIDTGTLDLSGNLASFCDVDWSSEGGDPDDTLTIRPKNLWPLGSGKTLTVECADLETYPIKTVSVTYGVLDGIVYVHAEAGSDDNPGTDDLPKKSIQAAVVLAGSLYDVAEVYVAEGTYQSNRPVTISKTVSLYGGFSADSWEVRETDADWAIAGESDYPTVIKTIYTSTGIPGEEVSALYLANIAGDIIVEGFYIKGAAGVGSNAVLINNCSPTIVSNSIDAGSGLTSMGIAVNYSSSIIEKNLIYGGESDLSTAVFCYESEPIIRENDINGGTGEDTTAIYCISSVALVMSNSIYGGNCRTSATGISNEAGSDSIIRNNTINAGTAYSTSGIRNKGSSPLIQNNTIHGGGASVLTDSIAEGIWNYNSSNPVIENNIIFTETGDNRYGISQGDIASAPDSLENNDIFDCPDALYIDLDGMNYYMTAAEVNGLSFASGNIDTTGTLLDDLFITPGGSAPDWHLETTAPVGVRQGGIDLSSSFTDDRDGSTRSVPWSMGAYEKD